MKLKYDVGDYIKVDHRIGGLLPDTIYKVIGLGTDKYYTIQEWSPKKGLIGETRKHAISSFVYDEAYLIPDPTKSNRKLKPSYTAFKKLLEDL